MSSLKWLALAAVLAGCGGEHDSQALDATEKWAPSEVREGNLRVVSFNIRNFPAPTFDEPVEGEEPKPAPLTHRLETDRQQLLGILSALDFDVMAVQEIVDGAALEEVLAELSAHTGRDYQLALSANANGNPQHVGIVIDAAKLTMDEIGEHLEVDVSGTLRPGLSARIRSLNEGGIDFGLMSLHLASGTSSKRSVLRAQQASQAAAVVGAQQQASGDGDYLVLGDLNSAEEEDFPLLDQAFAEASLARSDNRSGCSAYWVKKSTNPLVRPSWLDHVYGAALEEMDAEVPVVSGAHCAVNRCATFESRDAESGGSFYGVSDHCPVYFELRDTDVD